MVTLLRIAIQGNEKMIFFRIQIIALGLCCFALNARAGEVDCDAWFKPGKAPRGIVLLTHGMNLKPSCMDEMAEEFRAAGYEVYRPALTGHCGENKNYLNITAAQWEADAMRVHKIADARARKSKVPLFLVGYSFTPLIFQTLGLPFAKKIYFTPALSTKFWFPALSWLANTFPNFTYDSKVPEPCAANPITGTRAIVALGEFLSRWDKGQGKKDTTPALVFAEPGDELLSFGGLEAVVKEHAAWKLESISNAGATIPKPYHHMVVSPGALGMSEWRRVMKLGLEFLAK
jgi:hypothetical protein